MSMDADISLWLSIAFIVGGLVVLAKSADVFVDAASIIARYFGMSPLIVGMVIIGFGTSAPELAVSAISGMGGHSNLSLGNAYGSCIFNIAAILGVASLIRPISVKASVIKVAVPVLSFVTVLSWLIVRDGEFELSNGITLLALFLIVLPLYCWYDQRGASQASDGDSGGNPAKTRSVWWEFFRLLAGLCLLVLSSHVLVWGSVDFARDILHVSDLMIGLTIVAVGTSLPELASAIASARKGENEFVIGNIVGSNLFNTLAVVGLAGTISPFDGFSPYIISRDLPVILLLSLSIALFGASFRRGGVGRIERWEGCAWVIAFVIYLVVMIAQETSRS